MHLAPLIDQLTGGEFPPAYSYPVNGKQGDSRNGTHPRSPA